MMQKNELDRFFRDKLVHGESPVFNPAHWEDVKKQLTNEKKDRKAFYWILASGILVILILISYLYLSNQKVTPKEFPTSTPGENQKFDRVQLDDTKNNSALDKHVDDSKASANKHNTENILDIDENPELRKNSYLDKNKIIKSSELTFVENKVKKQPLLSLNELTELDLVDSELAGDKEVQLFSVVPIRNFSLNYQWTIRPEKEFVLMDEDKRYRRTRIAWSGSLLIDPAFSSETPVRGMIVGITYEKYLRENWFLGAKPSLQLRSGEEGFSKFEQVTTYGFSSSSTTYGLKANNLQFLSIPLYLGAEFKRHTYEAGISLDFLLAARGQLQQVSVENQSVINLQSFNSGWINTDHMQKVSTNLFFGYKNSITNQLKTGLTIFFNPIKIYPGLPNQLNQSINSKWYLGWQATYYIK